MMMMLFWPEKLMTPIVSNCDKHFVFQMTTNLEAYAKVGAFMDVERIFRVMEVQNEICLRFFPECGIKVEGLWLIFFNVQILYWK